MPIPRPIPTLLLAAALLAAGGCLELEEEIELGQNNQGEFRLGDLAQVYLFNAQIAGSGATYFVMGDDKVLSRLGSPTDTKQDLHANVNSFNLRGDEKYAASARGYIEDMPRALAAADVAVSRAGAMATAELLAWGIPAVLVPLPTAAANHQDHNARALAGAGAALYLPERDLTPERLWRDLLALTADTAEREHMAGRALERARPDAAREIAHRLLELVP